MLLDIYFEAFFVLKSKEIVYFCFQYSLLQLVFFFMIIIAGSFTCKSYAQFLVKLSQSGCLFFI